MLSQSDATNDPDILTLLKQYIKNKYSKPGDVYLGLVHRLDRPAGGIMIFARTSKAASRLSKQMREHSIEKRYLVVIEGKPETPAGLLENYLKKDNRINRVCASSEYDADAKPAKLKFMVIASANGKSLLSVNLLTGRSHQIRVQMKEAGMPVAGDNKYGKHRTDKHSNIALWAYSLKFIHPVGGRIMELSCLPPLEHPWNEFSEYLCKESSYINHNSKKAF